MNLQDISTLCYNDYQLRNGSVYYIFSYICPEEPPDVDSLKKTLNNYIRYFLMTIGINGLPSSYLGAPSIFIDSIGFREKILFFRVLYLNSSKSYDYYCSQLRKPKVETKPVYDDEI